MVVTSLRVGTTLGCCGDHSEAKGTSLLWWQSALQFPIVLLQYEEGFLHLAVIRDEPLTVEIILKTKQRTARTPKILENPRRHSAKKGNALQHGNLVLVQILLVLLGPASGGAAVVAVRWGLRFVVLVKRMVVYPQCELSVCKRN